MEDNGKAETKESAAQERFRNLYNILRMRICLLDYPPGTRLREEELAREFGVSRTPVRRVLGRLEEQGLVRSVQGVATIVTDVEIGELLQVYQLRMELAELVGTLSPVLPDEETMATFQVLGERARELTRRPDARGFAELNMDCFHALMQLTGNAPLREISERLYYQTARIWLKSIPRMDLAEEIRIFSREMDEIVGAIQIGDLEAAAHIRRSHISMSHTRLRRQAAYR